MNRTELGAALARMRGGLAGIALLSAAINILTLTGSIYLMVVYDRVLPAQSEPTLYAVFAMVGVAYAFFGAFDVLRSRMLGDVASALDEQLVERAQAIEARIALERPDQRSNAPMRDLDQLRGFLAGPGPGAIIDLPWIFFFLIVLTLMHWWFGVVTLIGALVLAGLTVIAERVNSTHVMAVGEAAAQRQMLGDRQWRHAELITALGMRERMAAGWRTVHREYLARQARLSDTASTLGGLSKIFRMFLQAAILTAGAILVIEGRATAGVIFASSIIAGRALAPVDQAIANWRGFVAARQSWARLNTLLAQQPEHAPERTELPPPARNLTVEGVALVPPGGQTPVVTDARFTVNAGQVLAVIGASASGKSSLMRGVVGAWRPARGTIRLDGATIDQWDGETLGRHIGYLPQSVELFRGTVAENIARFEPDAPSDAIIAAAQAAGVHDLILQLPNGYESPAGEEGGNLSAGQRQRIALARALYRQPFLLVLDEPNSNLDPDGEAALASAIDGVRARGGIVLVVTHRRALVGTADLLLVMRNGSPQAFGPRDEVLARMQQPTTPGGGGEPGLTVVGRRR